METDKRAIAQQVLQKIHDGTVPGKHCPLCGSAAVDAKTLYAVCERAERRWHDGGDGGGVFVTVIGWIPIVVPLPSNSVVEERRGRDLVVPLPLRVCRDCWRRLYGNVVERVFFLGLADAVPSRDPVDRCVDVLPGERRHGTF